MVKIVVVAATAFELAAVQQRLNNLSTSISYSVHGVGMLHTAFHIQQIIISDKPDVIIQVGIAGSYSSSLQIGDVTVIASEQIDDIGIETTTDIVPLTKTAFMDLNESPYTNGLLPNPHLSLFQIHVPAVQSLTVNVASGQPSTIQRRMANYHAAIENMEGAAFHYVALQYKIPFIQFRAISNMVEPRNTENWNIPLALSALGNNLYEFMKLNY